MPFTLPKHKQQNYNNNNLCNFKWSLDDQTVSDGVAHYKNPTKCSYHVTLDLDLEHTLDAHWPGVHRVQVWWRCGHLSARRSDLRKSLQTDGRTDRRRTPRHCISSFLKWANELLSFKVIDFGTTNRKLYCKFPGDCKSEKKWKSVDIWWSYA